MFSPLYITHKEMSVRKTPHGETRFLPQGKVFINLGLSGVRYSSYDQKIEVRGNIYFTQPRLLQECAYLIED